jgi:hypothetical protein
MPGGPTLNPTLIAENYFKKNLKQSPPNRKESGGPGSGQKSLRTEGFNSNTLNVPDMSKVVKKPAQNKTTLKIKQFYEPDAMTKRSMSVYSMDKSIYSRFETDHNIESFVKA